MINFKSIFSKTSLILIPSILFGSNAFAAAGTINFNINTNQSIPTLSGTMLIILSLLLFVVAMRVAKNKNGSGSKFFVMMIGTAAVSIGVGGFKVVSTVEAGFDPTVVHLDDSGSVQVPANEDGSSLPFFVANEDFPAGITITSVVPDEGSLCGQEFFDNFYRNSLLEFKSIQARPPTTTEDYDVIVSCEFSERRRQPGLSMAPPEDDVTLNVGEACATTCGSIASSEFEAFADCNDGIDNDGDGDIDTDDSSCQLSP